jgi:hypothetical protein
MLLLTWLLLGLQLLLRPLLGVWETEPMLLVGGPPLLPPFVADESHFAARCGSRLRILHVLWCRFLARVEPSGEATALFLSLSCLQGLSARLEGPTAAEADGRRQVGSVRSLSRALNVYSIYSERPPFAFTHTRHSKP